MNFTLPKLKFHVSNPGLFTQKTADGLANNIYELMKHLVLMPTTGLEINISKDGTRIVPVVSDPSSTDAVSTPTTAPITASVQSCSVTASDSSSVTASFVILLSDISSTDVSISYATADITAVDGTDYTGTSGTAVISAGDLYTTVDVDILTSTATGSSSFSLTISSSDVTVTGLGICTILPPAGTGTGTGGSVTVYLGGSLATPFLAVPAVVSSLIEGVTMYAVNIYFGSGIVKNMSGVEFVIAPDPILGATSSGILALCLTLDATTGVATSVTPSVESASWTAPASTTTTVWTAVTSWIYTAGVGTGSPHCVGYSLHGSFSHFYDAGVSTLTPL